MGTLREHHKNTKIVILRKRGRPIIHPLTIIFFFGDKLLTISNSVSYLGLVLSYSGKFSQAQSNI